MSGRGLRAGARCTRRAGQTRRRPRAGRCHGRPRRSAPRGGHRAGARRPRPAPPGRPRHAGSPRLHLGRRFGAFPLPLPGRHLGALPAERALRATSSTSPRRSTPIPPGPTPPCGWSSTTRPRPRRSSVEARHIVVPRAGANGTRPVLDLIVLRNDGRLARVAPDSSRPSWRLVLPPGTGDMEVGRERPLARCRRARGRHGEGAGAARARAEAALARVRRAAEPRTDRVRGRAERRTGQPAGGGARRRG